MSIVYHSTTVAAIAIGVATVVAIGVAVVPRGRASGSVAPDCTFDNAAAAVDGGLHSRILLEEGPAADIVVRAHRRSLIENGR